MHYVATIRASLAASGTFTAKTKITGRSAPVTGSKDYGVGPTVPNASNHDTE